MKCIKGTAFQPIIITIESEEEAEELWHRLNTAGVSVSDYKGGYKFNGNVSVALYEEFNRVYKPKVERKMRANRSTYKVWESGEESFRFNALLYGINNDNEDQTAEVHEEDGKLMAYGAYEDGEEFILQVDHPIYPIRYTRI